jgi:DNA-directed RNA polymerase subunit L
VSFANGIRRTIISDIPLVIFKTSPYAENKCVITTNSSRMNNEILKHRLSCIPIHIRPNTDQPLDKLIVEVDMTNDTDDIMHVTTEHFKIKNVDTNTYLSKTAVAEIFPPFIPSGGYEKYYTDLLDLRPKISDDLDGERIQFTCGFVVDAARTDAAFNAVSTCAYGFTPDLKKGGEELNIMKQRWKDDGHTPDEIDFKADNWKLIDGMRYVHKNSFDFSIESECVYSNDELVVLACDILNSKFAALRKVCEDGELEIKSNESTIENGFDVVLENEDYTVGNILNYLIYKTFYTDLKTVTYVGFKKMHPHDAHSLLRIGFSDSTADSPRVVQTIIGTIDDAIKIISTIKALFTGKLVK